MLPQNKMIFTSHFAVGAKPFQAIYQPESKIHRTWKRTDGAAISARAVATEKRMVMDE